MYAGEVDASHPGGEEEEKREKGSFKLSYHHRQLTKSTNACKKRESRNLSLQSFIGKGGRKGGKGE